MQENEMVFGYGSNMDLTQMQQRCPDSELTPFIAEARKWRLYFPRHSKKRRGGVGSITADANSSVWGVVFSVCSKDLKRLDSYEGVNSGSYKRERIDVHDKHGTTFNVWAYFAIPNGKREFTPHQEYIDLYVRGAEYFGLPEPYVNSLRELRQKAKADSI